MDAYMLKLNLRARGVPEDEISNAVKFGNIAVPTKFGTVIDVERRGSWYYFL